MVEIGRTLYDPVVQMMHPFMMNGRKVSVSRRVTFSLKECARAARVKSRASQPPKSPKSNPGEKRPGATKTVILTVRVARCAQLGR